MAADHEYEYLKIQAHEHDVQSWGFHADVKVWKDDEGQNNQNSFSWKQYSPIFPKDSQLTRERGGLGSLLEYLRLINLSRSTDQLIVQRFIVRKSHHCWQVEWAVVRSSEIKWMFAINVSFESPESRARWTDWMKRSNGVVEDDEEPTIE